jgi:S-adenosylmethionine hydrolase
LLFTDFGLHGPYTGQMKAALYQLAPGILAVDLFADAPMGNPKASACLLAAYAAWFPAGTIFLCVVDRGVGGTRPAIVLEADAGATSAPAMACLSWSSAVRQRRAVGTSTGGRSASRPAFTGATSSHRSQPCWRGEPPPGQPRVDDADRRADWPDDLCEIVYVDHFGNAMTGLRAAMPPPNARLASAGRVVERERTFSDRPPGSAFWYENSNGLAEIAVNQGRADRDLGLATGTPVEIIS